jgi:hypothetical protein
MRKYRVQLAHGKPPPQLLQRKRLAEFFSVPLTRAATVDDLSPEERAEAILYFIVLDTIEREMAHASKEKDELADPDWLDV